MNTLSTDELDKIKKILVLEEKNKSKQSFPKE
jgi:hypothetical protein